MDNGATTFPKAPGVAEAISNYINNIGSSINRGSYDNSLLAERIVYETRELLAELFNHDDPSDVVFTKNITESINVVLKGFLKEGDHVIVSSIEHNAVMRPLVKLEERGVTFTRVSFDENETFSESVIKNAIRENTKLIIINHGSNVSGSIQNIAAIGKIAKEHNIKYLIDAAQTAGIIDIDMKKIGADAIAFTGHKSLLGPQGIGGFVISKDFSSQIDTFIEGGTGSASESEYQPSYMPDKFESGTPNVVGIYGLNASLKYIKKIGIENIYKHEMSVTKRFLDGISNFNGLNVIGNPDLNKRTPVVSIDFTNYDNAEIAFALSSEFGIITRVGMHCAPSAHKTYNTFPQGTVRFSFSYATTVEDIDYALNAIKQIIDN
jgi:cysteine desulfurase family protein